MTGNCNFCKRSSCREVVGFRGRGVAQRRLDIGIRTHGHRGGRRALRGPSWSSGERHRQIGPRPLPIGFRGFGVDGIWWRISNRTHGYSAVGGRTRKTPTLTLPLVQAAAWKRGRASFSAAGTLQEWPVGYGSSTQTPSTESRPVR
jgi:hypothetical protein